MSILFKYRSQICRLCISLPPVLPPLLAVSSEHMHTPYITRMHCCFGLTKSSVSAFDLYLLFSAALNLGSTRAACSSTQTSFPGRGEQLPAGGAVIVGLMFARISPSHRRAWLCRLDCGNVYVLWRAWICRRGCFSSYCMRR